MRRTRRVCEAAGVLTALLALSGPSALAQPVVELPAHPAGLPWPTGSWPRGELPAGLDRARFAAQVERLFAGRGRAGVPDTRALLVVHAGRLVFERYAEGFDADSRFPSWSMAKSVTNAFVGILRRQGRLDLDAPAEVAEWRGPGDPRAGITPRHLLEMRSGLDNGDGFGDGDLSRAFVSRLLFGTGSRAPARYAADVPLVHAIGASWAYSTGSSILLARIAGEVVGGGARGTRDFLRRELFEPIGMRSAQPEFALSGEFVGGAYVHATARDWARFGYLYLRDGVWDGRRILPEGWVDYSRTPNPAGNNGVYGAHFWVNATPKDPQFEVLPGGPPTAFAAEGAGFQMVVIAPGRDLVAVRLGLDQATPYPEIKRPLGPLVAAFPERGGP
jgi:CubicO group peptidase (beta-lactamase class C family)